MSVGLLDTNMLIAFAWPSHVHHLDALRWFEDNQHEGWATCPMTESAFLRISSNRLILPNAVTIAMATANLHRMTALEGHVFWPDTISALDRYVQDLHIFGPQQITDAYLLGLALANKGKLVTLDQKIAALLPPASPHAHALEIVPTFFG